LPEIHQITLLLYKATPYLVGETLTISHHRAFPGQVAADLLSSNRSLRALILLGHGSSEGQQGPNEIESTKAIFCETAVRGRCAHDQGDIKYIQLINSDIYFIPARKPSQLLGRLNVTAEKGASWKKSSCGEL
jgi:hypothetical protein